MPSMITMDPLIRNVQNWHQHAYATPGIDEMVTALTQLRIIGFELLDLFWLDPLHTSPEFMKKDEFILRLCNNELDRWEARWHLIIDEGEIHYNLPPACLGSKLTYFEADATLAQRFLVRFYDYHLRLLLHSFQLQLSIANGSASKPALWVCYASSLEMVRLIIDRLGTTSYLYYCQDSIHVMVAYAAVAIVKVGLLETSMYTPCCDCRCSLLCLRSSYHSLENSQAKRRVKYSTTYWRQASILGDNRQQTTLAVTTRASSSRMWLHSTAPPGPPLRLL